MGVFFSLFHRSEHTSFQIAPGGRVICHKEGVRSLLCPRIWIFTKVSPLLGFFSFLPWLVGNPEAQGLLISTSFLWIKIGSAKGQSQMAVKFISSFSSVRWYLSLWSEHSKSDVALKTNPGFKQNMPQITGFAFGSISMGVKRCFSLIFSTVFSRLP